MAGAVFDAVGGLLQGFGFANADGEQHARDFVLYLVDQLADSQRFALVFPLSGCFVQSRAG